MLDNATRRQLLNRHKSSGFPGSIIDVYNAYNQGIDLISQFEMSNQPQMQVANTPQQQQEGLRPFHQQGQTNQSMVFPNVPPNTNFNTVGMKAPINIKKIDNQGNLVKSYENVPPGIQSLPTGPVGGTVIETPANMQSGGVKSDSKAVRSSQWPPELDFLDQEERFRRSLTGNVLPPAEVIGYRSIPEKNRRVDEKAHYADGTMNVDKFIAMGKLTGWKPWIMDIVHNGYSGHDRTAQDENVIEFFDGTGISSWDDAARAYIDWKVSDRTFPTFTEAGNILSAFPGANIIKGAKFGLTKFQKLKNIYARTIKGNNYINAAEDARQELIESKSNKKYGGVRKYQSGDFIYGDWREVSREVDPTTRDIIITEERDGSRTTGYNRKGVNWEEGYANWVAKGNVGSLEDFKRKAEKWKSSKTQTEYDRQNRTQRIKSEEENNRLPAFLPIPTLPPTSIPTSTYEKSPYNNTNPGGQGPYGSYRPLEMLGGDGRGSSLTLRQPNETIIEDDPNGVGQPLSPSYVESTYDLNSKSRTNRRGNTKTKSVYSEDINVTRADGTSSRTRSRQVNKIKPGEVDRTRGKSVFEEFDADGNRIIRQVDRLRKTGGVRKYQSGNTPPTFGKTAPDWRATGPALRVNDTIYRDHELTGATRIPIDPETGEQLPILLPTADVVGRQKYDDAITEAVNRTGSGLLGEYASPEDYKKMEGAVRSGMNNAGKDLLYAAGDVLSAPQRYLVNAPLAYGLGKTPNLSMFPSADRARGINQPNAFPSETLEIKNPIGAFATDVLTDPSVAASLGVGLGRAGLKQVANKTAKYATTHTPLRHTYRLNPKALKLEDVEILQRWHADKNPPGLPVGVMPDEYTGKWYGSNYDLDNNTVRNSVPGVSTYMGIRPGPGEIRTAVVPKGSANLPEELLTGPLSKNVIFSNRERILPKGFTYNVSRVNNNPVDLNSEDLDITRKTMLMGNELAENALPKPHWLKGYSLTKADQMPKQLPGPNTFNKYGGVRKYQSGDVIRPENDPWEYKYENGKYLAKKRENKEWIVARGNALEAIKTKIYGLPSSRSNQPTPKQPPKSSAPSGPVVPMFMHPSFGSSQPPKQSPATQSSKPPIREVSRRRPIEGMDYTAVRDNTSTPTIGLRPERMQLPKYDEMGRPIALRQEMERRAQQTPAQLRPAPPNYAPSPESEEPGYLEQISSELSSGITEATAWGRDMLSAFDRLQGKYGDADPEQLLNVPKDAIQIPQVESETQPIKETYTELGTSPDRGGRQLSSFIHSFDNETGGTFRIGPKVLELYDMDTGKKRANAQTAIPGVAVAHFFRDSDISPNQKYTPKNWKIRSGYQFQNFSDDKVLPYGERETSDPERYRMMYRQNEDGTYSVKYKRAKNIGESDEGWSYDLPVSGQHRFSDIDWDREGPHTGWKNTSHYVPLKPGAQNIASLNMDRTGIPVRKGAPDEYSRFSGGSIVLLFTDPKTGREIGIDVAGSKNVLRDTGRKLIKEYGLREEDVTVVYHDMGSYSAKPRGKDGKLDYDQWFDFNTYNRGYSGAPLIIANQQSGGLRQNKSKYGKLLRSGGVRNKVPYYNKLKN